MIATAIHNGHGLHPGFIQAYQISEADRLREEDPLTAEWTALTDNRIIGQVSRFAVDLNRPRDKAVYLTPQQAWGLQVWNNEAPAELIAESLKLYDEFYAEAHRMFSQLARTHGRFLVLDLHSYNHRRPGPNADPAPASANPEIIVGTSNMDRDVWAPVVDRFITDLRSFSFRGRTLDVRENVKFSGGHFSRWIHSTFPRQGCSLAIEFKKIFMDEWTGICDPEIKERLISALSQTKPGLLDSLAKINLPLI